MKKPIYITAIIILVLSIFLISLNRSSMKKLKTEIIIDAPTEKVWSILMAHETYPKWNPFITSITGTANVGETITVTLHPKEKKPMVFKPTVLKNVQGSEFRWLGILFVKGLVDGEHYFILEPIGPNQTRFIHGENFRGILVGLFLRMVEESTVIGFKEMNAALKEQAEKD